MIGRFVFRDLTYIERQVLAEVARTGKAVFFAPPHSISICEGKNFPVDQVPLAVAAVQGLIDKGYLGTCRAIKFVEITGNICKDPILLSTTEYDVLSEHPEGMYSKYYFLTPKADWPVKKWILVIDDNVRRWFYRRGLRSSERKIRKDAFKT